jgi:hypothetical protein
MKSRYVGDIVLRIRADASFRYYTTTTGIQNDEILDLINDGIDSYVSAATRVTQTLFQKTIQIPYVGLDTYFIRGSLVSDVKIVAIDVLYESSESYTPVRHSSIHAIHNNGTLGSPSWYLQDGAVYFDQLNDSQVAGIQVTYEERPKHLGLRAAKIIAGSGVGGQLSQLKVSFEQGFDSVNFNKIGDPYFNIVNKMGTVLMANIPYESCSAGTFTMSPYKFQSGETCTIGNYLIIGENKSSHSSLSREVEKYLVYYVTEQLGGIKGASDEKLAFLEKRTMKALDDAVGPLLQETKDITRIEISDYSYFL